MEGSKIEDVKAVSGSMEEIEYLKILSFYQNSTSPKTYEIELNGSNIKINGNSLYGTVKSIKINKEIVQESQIIGASPDYSRFSAIDFTIVLSGKRGFSGEVDYLVNFTVYFRNKGR